MSKLTAVMNRDHYLVSLKGYAIEFKKGVPTPIPSIAKDELVELGAEIFGNEEAVAAEKTQNLKEATLEADAANARAEAAAAQKELADIKKAEKFAADQKRDAELKKAKLKEAARIKVEKDLAEAEVKKEVMAEKAKAAAK